MYDTTEDDGGAAGGPADTALLRTWPEGVPPLFLAGVDEDGWEIHLVRGID
ncbi:MAG TPA: hypothetical protein VFP69_19875 [Streptomyces sp.]|nr:hypothetical protein [Streptomyces sp.]